VLQDAITARLQRVTGGREAVLNPNELPIDRPVPSDDQKTWGPGLEAIDFFTHQGTAYPPYSNTLVRLRRRLKATEGDKR
jgi:hypothetical protein